MSLEAAAGGKYPLPCRADFDVRHCETFLVSAIGAPINEPQLISLKITPGEERGLPPGQKKEIENFVVAYLNQKSRSRAYDEFYPQA